MAQLLCASPEHDCSPLVVLYEEQGLHPALMEPGKDGREANAHHGFPALKEKLAAAFIIIISSD